MTKKKRAVEGLVTRRSNLYTNSWQQTKFVAYVVDGAGAEHKVFFMKSHNALVEVDSRIRFEVGAEKYGNLRVYKSCKVEVLKAAPPAKPQKVIFKLGYVSNPRWDNRDEEYHCLSKLAEGKWLSIPCRAIAAWEDGVPIGSLEQVRERNFPGQGMGHLTALATTNGQYQVVEILHWESITKELEWNVPLSEVQFGHQGITVQLPDGDYQAQTYIGVNLLPWERVSPLFNEFKSEFVGTLTISAKMTGIGSWNRPMKKAEIHWLLHPGDATVMVTDDDLAQFEQVAYIHERQAAFEAVEKRIRELTSEGMTFLLVDVIGALEEEGVTDATEAEAEEILLKPEYDTKFMLALKEHQDAGTPIRYGDTGIWLTINGALVYERPMVGAATYIFSGEPTPDAHKLGEMRGFEDMVVDTDNWIATLITGFMAANKMDVRYTEVGELLGCQGFAVHGENAGRWLGQVLDATEKHAEVLPGLEMLVGGVA